MSSRYTHRSWKSFDVGEWLDGVWHEPPRRVETKKGRGHYYLGVVRQLDGSLVGITLPSKLERLLLDLAVGSGVRITYLGEIDIGFPYPVMNFDVITWPPVERQKEQSA
jgi:hypothetical protein